MCRLLVLLAWFPLAAFSQPQGSWHFPEDAEDKPWEEQVANLPPSPRQENLVKVNVEGATSFDFFVDLASISAGKDGVVRYTLIARSAGGAINVSFEGIKCQTRERKLYAFGRKDGSWSSARNPRWGAISAAQANRHHAALADDYFCLGRLMGVRNADEARRILRTGPRPRVPDNTDPSFGYRPG